MADIFLFPRFVDEKGQSVVDLQQIAQKIFKCELPPGKPIMSSYPVKGSNLSDPVFPLGIRWSFTPTSLSVPDPYSREISYGEWVFCIDNIYTYGKISNSQDVYFAEPEPEPK